MDTLTASGAAGRLDVTVDRTIAIELRPTGGAAARLTLPYPSRGWGGGELALSPRGGVAVLWMYSGPSEVGYYLLGLEPSLHLRAELPYVFGEGDAPRFTPDGRWLLMVYDGDRRWRDQAGEIVEIIDELPTRGRWTCEWLTIHVRATDGSEVHDARVVVEATDGFASPDPDSWAGWDRLVDVADDRAVLAMPWSEAVEVPIPPRGPVVVRHARPT